VEKFVGYPWGSVTKGKVPGQGLKTKKGTPFIVYASIFNVFHAKFHVYTKDRE
jgi:hypothetical protein